MHTYFKWNNNTNELHRRFDGKCMFNSSKDTEKFRLVELLLLFCFVLFKSIEWLWYLYEYRIRFNYDFDHDSYKFDFT